MLILIIIGLLLDGLLSTYISTTTYFIPLLTVTTIYLIYPKFKHATKKYFVILFITGVTYDLMYTNLLFFHSIIFIILGNIIKYIDNNLYQNKFEKLLYLILIIIIYELLIGLTFGIFKVSTITFQKLVYKISHSLITNLIYALIVMPFTMKKT